MDTIQEARTVLGAAEASLRELMEKGLARQRYGEVAEVARLAECLTRLRRQSGPLVASLSAGSGASATPEARIARRKKVANGSKSAYPRFERDGERLVKVGWSKKKGEQYEHRASLESIICFTKHLTNHVAEGKLFAMEDLFPVPDSSGGEVPAYQIYLTLAWLRQVGVVEKKGRDGYVLRDDSIADGGLEKLWLEIPTRPA